METPAFDSHGGFLRVKVRGIIGLLLLLALLLPLRLWRASWEESVTPDEMFTLMICEWTPRQLVEITTVDAHPPAFYFIMKAWLKAGRMVNLGPSILWARLPSTAGWAWMVVLAWFAGRWMLGVRAGTVFAWALGASAALGYAAREARNYSLATACLFTCYLIIVAAWHLGREGKLQRWNSVVLWAVYTIAGAMALWLHLLSSFVLLCLGILWIILAGWTFREDRRYAIHGAVANALVILLFSPWLLQLQSNLNHMESTPAPWMDVPTFGTWISALLFNYPFGRIGGLHNLAHHDMILAFFVLNLAPLVMYLFVRAAFPAIRPRLLPAVVLASGVTIPIVYTSILWMLSFLGVAKVFHADRYPVLAFPIWLMGMGAALACVLEALRLGRAWAWLLMLPWFGSAIRGHEIAYLFERRFGIPYYLTVSQEHLPPPGSVVHVSPSSLLTYLGGLLKDYDLVPVEDLATISPDVTHAEVFHLRAWMHIQKPADRVVLAMKDHLAGKVETIFIPPEDVHAFFAVYRLNGLRHERLARISPGWAYEALQGMGTAAAIALPEQQLHVDGFPLLELTSDGEPFSWGTKERVRIRFDQAIPPGNYKLLLSIYRPSFPMDEAKMTFRFEGGTEVFSTWAAAGSSLLEVPVTLPRSRRPPVLYVDHPVWQPSVYIPDNRDERELTFLFSRAWLVPDDGGEE